LIRYQGQVNHFIRAAPEKIEYAINRFKNETLRVFGVLEIQLSGKYTGEPKDYLAGKGKGKYSVADIKTWPWVKGWNRSPAFTEEDMKAYPHLLKWIDRIAERPAVKRGIGEAYDLKK
jgi:glutathione S-transferase